MGSRGERYPVILNLSWHFGKVEIISIVLYSCLQNRCTDHTPRFFLKYECQNGGISIRMINRIIWYKMVINQVQYLVSVIQASGRF